MNDLLCEILSQEIKQFLEEPYEGNLSEYARLKIFTSAYLHMNHYYALFIGPDNEYEDEPEEIIDLWGLSFCRACDYDALLHEDVSVLKGIREDNFRSSWERSSNFGENIFTRAVFTLIKKVENADIRNFEKLATKIFPKDTYHRLSWNEYTLWWRLDDLPKTNVRLKYKYLTKDYYKKIAIKLKNRSFNDPYQFDFDSRYVLSNINERDFTYKNDALKIPARRFSKGKSRKGYLRANRMPNQLSYRKRKLVLVGENKVLVCGASGIQIIGSNKKKAILCDPNQSPYQTMLAEKLCDQMIENPRREIKVLKGTWMSIHLQNNVISHFFFEVLRPLLFAARICRFGILFTGVIPAPHILEFFTTNSELKDKIKEIIFCNAKYCYSPENALMPFMDTRELSPEDANNFAWYGESIVERHRTSTNHAERIYISRRDSPASRVILNENELITMLEKSNYEILRFDKLNLVEKLVYIKYAKEIVSPAGSGLYFRKLLSTSNKVQIITSDTYLWNDFSFWIRGANWRNETILMFESEKSLGSEIFPTARNHASLQIENKFLSSITVSDHGEQLYGFNGDEFAFFE